MVIDNLIDSVNHFCRGRGGMEIEIVYDEFEDVN